MPREKQVGETFIWSFNFTVSLVKIKLGISKNKLRHSSKASVTLVTRTTVMSGKSGKVFVFADFFLGYRRS